MKTIPVPLEAGRANCADPVHLPLVDAAHARPAGPEAQQMKRTLCRHCPVKEACAQWANSHAEVGIWAETTPYQRKKAGAPASLPTVPRTLYTGAPEGIPAQPWRRKAQADKAARPKAPRIDNTSVRCQQLGIRPTGRVSLAHVEAWATAHQAP